MTPPMSKSTPAMRGTGQRATERNACAATGSAGARRRATGPRRAGARGDAAQDHELPDAQALEIERVEATILDERAADVDLVVDAVGLLLLEVVREDVLRRLLLEIEVRGDHVRDARDAVFEDPALA